jgi:DNA-binding LacI/PurR family transcriptional regulator
VSTIKDVARRAGVAISTVSAVINRSAPVSQRTIARVERAIAEIGYLPHGAAQSLRSGQSRMIGLIVPNITNPHFSATARIIENVCLSAGYMSMVYSTGQDSERESRILKIMRQQRVAGLIIIPTRSDAEHGERLKAEIHVPTVLLDMYVEGLPYDVIKLDNVKATRLATEHLIALGHRRIAVTTGIAGLATSEDRLAGYIEAHAAHGIAVDRSLLLRGDFEQDLAFASVIEVMQTPAPPSAILSISNMMTLGVLLALRKLDLGVPDDVSLVGIDDFDFAEIMNPPPTVIRVPVPEMAERAIAILLDEIASKRKPSAVRQVFSPTLIERASCRRLEAVPA